MSEPHLERDAELLARAIRGELARDDDALLALLRRRPDWSDVLDELSDGSDEGAPAELRALARAHETAADRERMSALLERASVRARGPRARPRWRLLVLLAAALVAVLGVAWWIAGPPPETPRGPDLGEYPMAWVAPLGTVEAWETFSWEAELPRRGSFTLIIRSDDEAAQLLAEKDRLTEPSWTVDPDRASGWPDAIVVTVVVVDALQGELGSLEVHLRRSPR